jgi:hypothetical protein
LTYAYVCFLPESYDVSTERPMKISLFSVSVDVTDDDIQKRREILPAFQILAVIGLKEGDIFADIGAGTGYFSIPAVEIIGFEQS